MPQRSLYALLIGINHYKSDSVPNLGGCVNDVTAMRALLQSHFGVAAEAITELTNEAATYATIRTAFQERLLAPLQAWAADGHTSQELNEQPAVLFYFSGHGSQARTANKPSGFDETLVPHDSRTDGVYDIKDWELGQWVAGLTPYTTNVTVILDCCHSGSGTRAGQKQVSDERGCPADERPQPSTDGIFTTRVMRGALDQSQQRNHHDHVLLAACRNDEKAREALLGEPPQRQGIFTYWLLDALRNRPPHQPLSYRDLYDQVRHQIHRVQSRYGPQREQTPQCEGDRDRLFLGDFRSARSRWLSVIAERDGLIWVNSGEAQGLSAGTILHLYPQEIDIHSAPQEMPIATLQVDRVEAVQSGCIRIDSAPLTPIPPGARAFVHSYGKRQRIKVALDLEEGIFLNTVRERLFWADIRPQIELALPHERATLRLAKVGDTLQLLDGAGQQRYQQYNLRDLNRYRRPFQSQDLDPVVHDLRHLVSQAQVGAIASASGSEIAAALEIKLERLIVAAGTDLLQRVPLSTDPNGNILLAAGEPFVLSITNRYTKPLYLTVLELGYTGDINRLYPSIAGEHVAIAVGKTERLGYSVEPKEQFVMRLPPGRTTVEETLKVIATTEEANFDHLLQGELPSHQKAGPIMRGGQPSHLLPTPPVTRSYQLGGDLLPEDKWGTVELRVKVVREAAN